MKKHFILAIFLLIIIKSTVQGNACGDSVNLIVNGNFEQGNTGFTSDFKFSNQVKPGEYSITKYAANLNPDFANPKYGDHTSGRGWYLIANSNDEDGLIVWKTKVKVIPNSIYYFSVHFCNLYKTQNSNSGFMVNGIAPETSPIGNDPNLKVTINKETVLEDERDIFHTFGWLRAGVEWYSGKASGLVEICIQNTNSRSLGNDLALDDISFFYIKTMPEGYEPPINSTELSAEYRERERLRKMEDPRKVLALNQLGKGDSIAPGIYTINRKGKHSSPVIQHRKFDAVLFEQSKSELSVQAMNQLDSLADYLKNNSRLNIQLNGFTESVGNKELNLKLSEERAIVVKNYLINKGIEEKRIATAGFGSNSTLNNNQHEEFRKLNRRVEIEILNHDN